MSAPPGNIYHHIQISSNARILLGNALAFPRYCQQSPESLLSARADYTGQYANW